MKFSQLGEGTCFVFEHELTHPFDAGAKGPWVKLRGRKYRHKSNGHVHTVGSSSASVVTEEQAAKHEKKRYWPGGI